MIKRDILKTIKNSEKSGFINIIYGPRRVGKTVLLNQIISQNSNLKSVVFNGDTQESRDLLSSTSQVKLTNAVSSFGLIAIDEAQRINNIGLSLKIIVDNFPNKKIYVTGSSSIDIAKGLKETLTGRTVKHKLYPLSTNELTSNLPGFERQYLLESQLIYGGYPYLLNLAKPSEKQDYLESIVEDYLFKDIFLLKDVSQPDNLKKLATLLAFQIGSEVSINELSNSLGVDVKTVVRYLSLLKQSFIIFEQGAFSKNLRKEVVKSKKYYFWDLGIRNALIRQYFDLSVRNDVGALWENFLAAERIKKQEYSAESVSNYFWRTYDGAEVDWVEVGGTKIKAFEFKYSGKGVKTPKAFYENYGVKVKEVSKDNYLQFVV